MSPVAPPDPALVAADVARALSEDLGSGDATASLLPADRRARAVVVAKEAATLAGGAWFDACFLALDPAATIGWNAADGDAVANGTTVCTIEGRARALVSAERSALNFLQTLSGTATTTAAYVRAIAGTRATILDTRKTLPGLRLAQKYAVRCGGGSNHRIGLYDAVLIKENHVAACGSIGEAIARARVAAPGLLLEVEVESLAELDEALAAKPDRILIDDFTLADMQRAVERAGGACPLEVSGGVSLETVRAIAQTGVDYISVGALTKHVRAVDLSMRVIG
ncbi:MAG TPA: carboxylating nicotinate-nucleotide diphosphorylase [Xanthomonadales bacterium]|nr:carboxylating nicotinate-nucleotide diphosphorylase [Xanthomonadales bacterium]